MQLVATIIADDSFNLNEYEVNEIISALEHNGARVSNLDVLADRKAVDIYFDWLDKDEAKFLLSNLLASFKMDFAVQSPENRKKKLLISDMDSTIIGQECIDELADCLGIKPKISEITERAMNGELNFEAALEERVGLLKGLPESELQRVFDERITFTNGAKTLVQTMKANGAKCVLVSGGFTFFTSRVAEAVGFDAQEANFLDFENGALTGKVKKPIVGAEAKLNAMDFYCEELGIRRNLACAVGDGANDLPMIREAGLGVAFCAKKKVQAEAEFQVNMQDLRNVLYFQGYKKNEFIEG